MERSGCLYPVLWLKSGLHNTPSLLREEIQKLLDQCRSADTVLLAMGLCGNSVNHLKTHGFRMVLPRVDDCISLLLGSVERRQSIAHTYGNTYFMTDGWLKGEKNIWSEYQYAVQKYGEDMGKRIFDTMFHHYQNLALIDTGCYPVEAQRAETRRIAEKLTLAYQELSGGTDYLEELLSGSWPEERYFLVPPYSVLEDPTL